MGAKCLGVRGGVIFTAYACLSPYQQRRGSHIFSREERRSKHQPCGLRVIRTCGSPAVRARCSVEARRTKGTMTLHPCRILLA